MLYISYKSEFLFFYLFIFIFFSYLIINFNLLNFMYYLKEVIMFYYIYEKFCYLQSNFYFFVLHIFFNNQIHVNFFNKLSTHSFVNAQHVQKFSPRIQLFLLLI